MSKKNNLSQGIIKKWIDSYESNLSHQELSNEKRQRELEKENKALKKENDFLKKAAAFFAKNQNL